MTRFLKIILFFSLLLIAACTVSVPILKPEQIVACQGVDKSLAEPCRNPAPLVEGSTYDQGFAVDAEIRRELRSCKVKHAALTEFLASCNEAVNQYNQKVKKLSK